MGNLADLASGHKYEIALGSLALSLCGFAYYQKHQTEGLRLLANSIDPYIPRISHPLQELYA
jgi:hypothetical protein